MPTPSKKALTILFTISLVLNLFLGGLIGSHLWHSSYYGSSSEHSKPHGQRKQWRELSSDQRDLFKKVWREHKSEIRSSFKEMRGAHKRLKANIKGVTERSDFEAAFSIFLKEQDTVHSQTIDKLLDIAMTLPPEDRIVCLSLWGTGPGRPRPH